MTNPRQDGFTLIELMIVVAIIGILASLALPAYQDYVVKAKMSEGILILSQCRTAVTEVYQTGSGGPGGSNWGCGEGTTQTQYVSLVDTDPDGVVTVTMRNIDIGVDGSTIQLVPQTSPGVAAVSTAIPSQLSGFVCRAGTVDLKYLPGSCK